MHASNPSNCTADEMNVRLVSFTKGTWFGEVSPAKADDWLRAQAASLAAPLAAFNLITEGGGGS